MSFNHKFSSFPELWVTRNIRSVLSINEITVIDRQNHGEDAIVITVKYL